MEIRLALMEDARNLLEWRNDFETRKNSYSQEEVSFERHVKWLAEKLKSDNCKIYIVEDLQGNEVVKIGTCRLDLLGDEVGEVSINLNPKLRGQGYGVKVLLLLEGKARQVCLKTLVAEIKAFNLASQKTFEKARYVKSEEFEKNGEKIIKYSLAL